MAAGTILLALTAGQFDAALAKAKAAGFSLSPSGGSLPPTDGVCADYSVDKSPAGVIAVTITITKKPFFVSVGVIESHIKQLLGVR